jgi:hypothetical protein
MVFGKQGFESDMMAHMRLLVPVDSVASYKPKELLPLKCEHCCKIFYKRKSDVSMSLKGHPDFALRFCSLKCHHLQRVKDTHIEMSCAQCGKPVMKQISWIKKNKYNFCSRSCSATFQNKHKTLGKSKKSKAETYLADLIRADFSELILEENVRSILPSGLELDIYIPALRLAIELNGPLHYFPIHGETKLKAIRDRDILKQVETQANGFSLIVVNTSRIKYWQETKSFLDSQYKGQIEPLIRGLMPTAK